ncbi:MULTISPECIES: hypothetical protein [Pseudomonas]|uniref:hypothetical protein n=1 Tax=Pseudomonas TaxID=286 RepID=UPI001BE81CE0|nr:MULTISPECIES: hypothetical protein [Pseudomonas]MBT2339447.1 hypothetical protein [Pseudomonas fluorescens]MCD4529327.1 hypothetical protein [Pseudomonas sp. C3-2018]
MLDQRDGSQDDESASEIFKLTGDERKLLTLYREMSDIDRRHIRRMAEVLIATSE